MLISLLLVDILQSIHISKHHLVHLNYMQVFCQLYLSKAGGKICFTVNLFFKRKLFYS